MVISQGEVWWADVPPPSGSEPGFRRPVAVVQGDALNRSRIATVVCVPLTSNLKWADAPGNVRLGARATSLPKESVANVSQIVALDKSFLTKATTAWPPVKKQLTIRIDEDVLSWLKANGRGYQTRINRILRVVMESRGRADPLVRAGRPRPASN